MEVADFRLAAFTAPDFVIEFGDTAELPLWFRAIALGATAPSARVPTSANIVSLLFISFLFLFLIYPP
jgi:hypothetical protein